MPDIESEWLAGARRLEEKTLAEIYDTLSPGLYRYAFRLLGDATAAEDLVAEVFQRLLLALRAQGGPRQHLRAYLYRVAHNLAMDFHRRHRTRPSDLNLDDLSLAADDDPAHTAERRLAQDRARAALWHLTAEQRQVIILKYLEGMSNEEVAATLNKPVGAVKSLQHRALEALRRMLTRTAGEMERVA